MAESFENLDTVLRDWVKDKVKKLLWRHWTGTRSRKNKDKAVFFFEIDLENTREVLAGTQLVLVSREPHCCYLEFNKPNKQNVCATKLFEKFIFSHPQNNC